MVELAAAAVADVVDSAVAVAGIAQAIRIGVPAVGTPGSARKTESCAGPEVGARADTDFAGILWVVRIGTAETGRPADIVEPPVDHHGPAWLAPSFAYSGEQLRYRCLSLQLTYSGGNFDQTECLLHVQG